jgi:hypothetical protein
MKVTKNMIAFGNYLLSAERKQSIMSNPETTDEQKQEIVKTVTDADVQNFKQDCYSRPSHRSK